MANGLGALLGWFWYYLLPIRRRVTWDNLKIAFPDWRPAARRRVARRCYVHLARSAIEFMRMSGLTPRRAEALVERVGWDIFEKAESAGRGVIVVTAHFGNFDLMACSSALRGVPLHVLTREQHVESVNRFWMEQRARHGVGLLPAKKSALRIHKLLKQGQALGLVIDQHMPVGRGLPVPFFGRLASTTHAPAALALVTGAPLVPVTIERLPGGRHRLTVDPPVPVRQDGDRQQEILRVTTELNHWLEEKIRARPDHWLWLHRRWKIDPELP